MPKRLLDNFPRQATDIDFFNLGNPNLANSSDEDSEHYMSIRGESPTKKAGMPNKLS